MKQELYGQIIYNYGVNNYSHGMEAIIFNPKTISIEEVKNLPDVFLHPTVKANSLEIFALYGTEENYKLFLKSAIESQCAKLAVDKFGIPDYDDAETWSKLHDYEQKLESEFKLWYEKEGV